MKPSIGRIVHIRWDGGSPREAAIVTAAGFPFPDDGIAAHVFSPRGGSNPCGLAVCHETGDHQLVPTWHWPERVE